MKAGWGWVDLPPLGRLVWLVLVLGGLAACNTAQTYVPNAVVILNPTPGQPSVYNAQIGSGGVVPGYGVYPCPQPAPYACPQRTPLPADACAVRHTVKAGDTVSWLAVQYHTHTGAIIAANGLTNPDLIRVGQSLCIPAKGPRSPSPTSSPGGPTATPAPAPLATATPLPEPSLPTATPGKRRCSPLYVTRSGDTVAGVAFLCGVTPAALLAANPQVNTDIFAPLYPIGQLLSIP